MKIFLRNLPNVRNKTDICAENVERRKVRVEDALSLAHRLNCPYIETSAKTGVNIKLLYDTVIREVRQCENLCFSHKKNRLFIIDYYPPVLTKQEGRKKSEVAVPSNESMYTSTVI